MSFSRFLPKALRRNDPPPLPASLSQRHGQWTPGPVRPAQPAPFGMAVYPGADDTSRVWFPDPGDPPTRIDVEGKAGDWWKT